MDNSYRTFISFARGIQNGFKPNDFPLLDEDQAEKEYTSVLSRFSFSMDVEKDILDQFYRGDIDSWDAIEQLEDECNYSYDEACRKIKLVSSVQVIPTEVIHLTPVFSMAYGREEFVPKYVLDRFHFLGYDGWLGEEENVQNGVAFARFIRGGDKDGNKVTIYFLFARDTLHKSMVETSQGDSFKFRALYVEWGSKRFGAKFSDGSLPEVEDSVITNWLGVIQELGLEETSVSSPLLYVKSNFQEWQHTYRLLVSKKRKRSKYHGALVNNTFDDASYGVSGVPTAFMVPASSSIKTHPSIRYLVVNHLINHSKRHLVKSSLSGTLDTFLLQNYCAGLGSDNVGANIKDTGDNGRVELHFNTENSFSTYVDLGGSLGTGYVVTQIDDGLGLFPEGTEVGDLLDNAVVQEIVRSQGERDSGVVISSISSNVGLALDQSTGAGVVEVFFDLAAGVRDFNRLFGQYIQFVQGDVFQAVDRDSTKDSVRAKECLNDMSQCLLRVTNDCIKLRKCLGLGLSYSDEEVKEVNNNIVDLVGTWDQVEARFNNLSNPSDVLSGVFFDFQRTLREFSSSIDAYNLNIRSGTQLCSVRQALGIIQKRIQGLRDGWR